MIIVPIIAMAFAGLMMYCRTLTEEKYVELPVWPNICVHLKLSKESVHIKVIETL